ncbi:hypothetical protein EY643_15060 [Halioglobus maricola]|uniref:LssY-like C-terminal domain-containing protein n=2 Tax=Halioglobus maricola TaxID=2601894 RepID=A0A5P9NLX4_9GAMM|nr:hypothetical protein EY643_15060 [Halioglobus maricola]
MRSSALYLLLLPIIVACASRPYDGAAVGSADFLQRAVILEQGDIRVSAAVPTAEEAAALTGLDLYAQGIQPIWLKVENRSPTRARMVTHSIDPDYYSPIEVAYMNRRGYSSQGYDAMQRWFHENSMPRFVPPGETRSGLVFSHLRPGSKAFNLNLIHGGTALDFTFFVPLPGFVPDFLEVNFDSLYTSAETAELSPAELRTRLEEELACCGTNVEGTEYGAPFNAVLVGTGQAVRRAMLRGGWLETSRETEALDRARLQSYRGREPDAIFTQWRRDGNERIQMHLWLAPWQVDGEAVWLAQVFYYADSLRLLSLLEGEGHSTGGSLFFARESVTADIDSAQRFLFQNLWYHGSLAKVAYVTGVGEVSIEEPRTGFGGEAYFTDGLRLVAFLSEDTLALDETRFLFDGQAGVKKSEAALFDGRQVSPPNDRLHIEQKGHLTIATAVPSKEETRAIFGMDLYARNIQPVWVQVENKSESMMYLTPMGVDRAYFTPRETAHRSRADYTTGFASRFESVGHARLAVAPQSIQSAYIFTRVDEGTKSFNVDVVGDGRAYLMSFHVPVPGLRLDHHEVDIAALYPQESVRDVTLEQLVAELETMPCCVRDSAGEDKGDPLNIAFVGDGRDMYYALMRAGWDETETIYGTSLLKTAASALLGDTYRYSPVSALYVFGRGQDAALQRARTSINERNHLRVWMSPLRHEGKPVWIGQISRDIGVRFTRKTITTHKIDPDVDETREFLLEDLAFSQGIKAFGYVGGVGSADYDQPRGNLTGDPYFTDGNRLVMWLSHEPVGLDEILPLNLTPYHTGHIGP